MRQLSKMSTTAGNTVNGLSLPENVSVIEMISLAVSYFHAHICSISTVQIVQCVTCVNRVGIEALR